MFHGSRCGWLAQYVSLIQAVLGIVEETGAGIAPLKGQLRVILAPADSVERLQAKLDLPAKLGDVGIRTDEISQIVANGFRPDRMANNPRQVTAEDLTMLLVAIL